MLARTRIPLIFGTMTLGLPGSSAVRVTDKKEAQDILDTFFGFGHKELDTARIYCGGTTEQLLSQLDLQDATIDTKVYPVKPGDHAPHALRETFQTSLKALNRQKVRVLYLHAPDRSVPFEDTLKAVDELYREGLFEIFGLSNYAAWEVNLMGSTHRNELIQPIGCGGSWNLQGQRICYSQDLSSDV